MAGQLWAVNSLGGFFSSYNLSKELRYGVQATSKFRQFCDVRDAFGKVTRHGQTFTWDTVPMMSRADRTLVETNTMPQGNHTVYQGTLTMSELGFSVPFTEMLESMSEFTVKQPIMKVLKYDAMCMIDCLVHQQFNKTALRASATATADEITLVTNSIATVTCSFGVSLAGWKSMVDTLKTRNVPFYTERDYFAIARPYGLRQIKNQLETIHQYTPDGLTMIMNGEIGRYEMVRAVEQTVIPAGGAVNSTTFNPFTDTADPWDTRPTSNDWVFMFGADTACEAVHTEEEIRAKIPDDFGRSKGVAWYGLMGYGLTHNDSNNLAQSRIIKYDSAV